MYAHGLGGTPTTLLKTFCDRLRHRKDVWWGVPAGLRHPSAWRRPLHRVLDTHLLRHRDWPLERWRCCEAWQRCLSNKWNSREFAAMHGVAVPELYWMGRDLSRFPVDDLPSRFAVRRAWGAASIQTHLLVNGRELIEDRACTPQELYATLRRRYGRWTVHPLLVEEYLDDVAEDPRARQLNFYCFGGHVGLIEYVEPTGLKSHRSAYDPAWQPFPEGLSPLRPLARPIAAPVELEAMLAIASRLGAAYGTFVRVDLFLSRKGIYFGEFSCIPFNGRSIATWADD